ncbi:hypothetical protein HanXRQr2_Chr03g0130091 [Helianthus annuus]|uniref:Uncharacterized protein n=1 Tax=Helianthus annuus TaxID=4232 RepID=A0A9K3NWL8_HELAN|nr:hypothetical protein HanXRQr2_Chr03g0130091 [Helianthus annuus]KAJ0945324.1 hypothetical protein HanPSC8_Chr03g0126911 [Helianthus annuus]
MNQTQVNFDLCDFSIFDQHGQNHIKVLTFFEESKISSRNHARDIGENGGLTKNEGGISFLSGFLLSSSTKTSIKCLTSSSTKTLKESHCNISLWLS